ncbi:MAG: NYN domain-containing protein [Desulfobaccales bacterium]
MAIFIDGGYMNSLLSKNFSGAHIDYAKFAQWISYDFRLLRAYFYDCDPYMSSPPTDEETKRFKRKQSFFSKILRIPCFEVKKGRVVDRGRDNYGNVIAIQKQIDVLLAVDLLKLSWKRIIACAAIVTGDSDFVPAIQAAKEEGVCIRLVHGPDGTYHRNLWEVADERLEIKRALIEQIRL